MEVWRKMVRWFYTEGHFYALTVALSLIKRPELASLQEPIRPPRIASRFKPRARSMLALTLRPNALRFTRISARMSASRFTRIFPRSSLILAMMSARISESESERQELWQ
ncbi:MAG: hypothetical protein BYD32DRAFT_427990 [Podila humilis]|nr:MAG: hypothetical protein BYD32DRAFT_427990 [Podila humilis]